MDPNYRSPRWKDPFFDPHGQRTTCSTLPLSGGTRGTPLHSAECFESSVVPTGIEENKIFFLIHHHGVCPCVYGPLSLPQLLSASPSLWSGHFDTTQSRSYEAELNSHDKAMAHLRRAADKREIATTGGKPSPTMLKPSPTYSYSSIR